ncbi:MAG: DUF6350 family protein [Microbacteriaceae bacterium]
MNRSTTAMLAALEGLIVAAIGIGIALVPLTVLWAAQYHLGIDWSVFWRAAADLWLAGHGVNLTVTLDAVTATGLGLPGAAIPFQITIAALGLGLLVAVLGVRTGLRAAASAYRPVGVLSAVLGYAAVATVVTFTAGSAVVQPSLWQGILLPTLVYGVAVILGAEVGQARLGEAPTDAASRAIRARLASLSPAWRTGLAAALRAGTAVTACVVGVSAVLVAVLLVAGYGTVIGLYEGLQAGILGGAALTIGQLALLPNVVVWAASWLIGPGFAIGSGSSVSPLGTQLGPLPSLPLFGILPQHSAAIGFAGVLVPLLAGFWMAVLTRSRLAPASPSRGGLRWLALVVLGIGIVAGIELGLLAWWSSGSLGPGRLHDVGPNPWLVAAVAAIEVTVSAAIGVAIRPRAARHGYRTASERTESDAPVNS